MANPPQTELPVQIFPPQNRTCLACAMVEIQDTAWRFSKLIQFNWSRARCGSRLLEKHHTNHPVSISLSGLAFGLLTGQASKSVYDTPLHTPTPPSSFPDYRLPGSSLPWKLEMGDSISMRHSNFSIMTLRPVPAFRNIAMRRGSQGQWNCRTASSQEATEKCIRHVEAR
ncbi:hypothetical protein BDP55DRAFT_625851 [Colletotrichum godetiae]|uniref:Uncharacterized protein n=1 Tax=Colletotrichum godetiae TaxID=1209918 RepID=A0AAJ0B226_9PEZI|nr:uncharacterized protein BDP55DRAFT_625851 [Colletotrichum godetiae]KAK1700252.1 hypothetical protein BDP55DRAFT_625851 [Colletotrichum godetiae]